MCVFGTILSKQKIHEGETFSVRLDTDVQAEASEAPAFLQNGIFRILLIPGKPLLLERGSAASSRSLHSVFILICLWAPQMEIP